MSSPYSGTLDLLQSSRKGCFDGYPKMKVSHERETEARLWAQSSDGDIRGNQDAIPLKCVAPRR